MARFRVDRTTTPTPQSGWVAISQPESHDDGKTDEKQKATSFWKVCERAIGELLNCDQVMVLTGLGTSLGIKDTSGQSTFPTMSNLWNFSKEKTKADKFEAIQKHVNYHGEGKTNIEDLLSRCLMSIELSNGSTTGEVFSDISAFVSIVQSVIRDSCRKKLNADDTRVHEDFLRRLSRRSARNPRSCLFTTNYDMCFEQAAANIRLTFIDGFSFSSTPRFIPDHYDYDIVTKSSYSKEPDYIPNLIRLYKLHGSVDWVKDNDIITKDHSTTNPLLIYPHSDKYAASYSPPFIELMARFQTLLRIRNLGLLVVCCGFNDPHIAEPVLSAIKSNANMRVAICDPDLCDYDAAMLYKKEGAKGALKANSTLSYIDRLVSGGDKRITLINGYFDDLTSLMPMNATSSDQEKHEERILATDQVKPPPKPLRPKK